MAGLAHAGVGLASKRFAPNVPVIVLILAAYVIDFIWGFFFFAGIEDLTGSEQITTNQFSHSLFMALIWSLLFGAIAVLVTHNWRTSLVIGLLVISHWIIDFISHPMTAVFPDNTGLPLFLGSSPLVGLGVWRTQWGVSFGEYGTLIIGLIIYIATLRTIQKDKRALGHE